MNPVVTVLTVCFEDPFWVGVLEQTEGGRTRVCRVVFGAEPKEGEVYAYFLRNYTRLRWSPPVDAARQRAAHGNPKRAQRAAQAALSRPALGTKAQQALKLQQEQGKAARRVRKKARDEAAEARKFALRQEKRREKHKGH